MNNEEVALWHALRAAVVDHPGLGVTEIGPKPELYEGTRVTIGGRQWRVLLVPVEEES